MRKLAAGTINSGLNIGGGRIDMRMYGSSESYLLSTDIDLDERCESVRLEVLLDGLYASDARTLTFEGRLFRTGPLDVRYVCPVVTMTIRAGITHALAIVDIPVSEKGGYPTYLSVSVSSNLAQDSAVAVTTTLYTHDREDASGDVAAAFEGLEGLECELTIQTTELVAVPACKVWLSTTNEAGAPYSVPQYTTADGIVTFRLEADVMYFIHCSKVGYSFLSDNWTPTVAVPDHTSNISEAISISVVPQVEAAFLTRTIATIRKNVDEPTLNAKYTDTELIKMIGEAYVNVLSEVNRNRTNPVVGRITVTMVEGVYTYTLPYHAGTIVAIYSEDTASGIKWFWTHRSPLAIGGRGVWVEGLSLKIQPGYLPAGTELTVEFIPGGAASLHMGRISGMSDDGLNLILSSAPTLGALDGHENAYAGCTIRTGLGSTLVEERTIASYNRATRTATLDSAITWAEVTTPYYEIAPQIYLGLDHAVGLYMAYWISGIEGHPVRNARLEKMYNNAMRNLRLDGFYSRLDTATGSAADSFDYHRYKRLRR